MESFNGLAQYGALGFLCIAAFYACRELWKALQQKEKDCREEREKTQALHLAAIGQLTDVAREISEMVRKTADSIDRIERKAG